MKKEKSKKGRESRIKAVGGGEKVNEKRVQKEGRGKVEGEVWGGVSRGPKIKMKKKDC